MMRSDLGRRLTAAWQALRPVVPGTGADAHCAGDRRLSALLSSAPAVVYAANAAPPHVLTYVSANIREMTGHPSGLFEAEGGLWSQMVHPDDHANRARGMDMALSQGHALVEYRYRHGDGSWRWVRDQMRRMADDAELGGEIVGSLVDVTDRRISEDALAASEARLRATQRLLSDALESSEDAFTLFDANDELVLFNSRYRTLYPLIADLIRPGVKFEVLLRASVQRGQYLDVPPDEMEKWIVRRLARHRRASGVFEQNLSDGRCLEIVERSTSEGGRVAIRRDVTARKRIEEALRQELSFEQTMLDAMPFPVFFKDRNGRFLGCNAQLCAAAGRSMAEIVGRTLHEILPAEKADLYDHIDREIFERPGVQSHELTLQWADGTIRRINLVTGTFNGTDGQPAGFIGSLIDITPQKRAEEQLVQAAKLATLGQIASEVAHELNQPLSIIRMSAETLLARSPKSAETLEQKLSTIAHQVARMAEMVDHLRAFSRFEGGKKRLFPLPQVVRAAAGLLVPHFQLDGIALDIDMDENCPDILGDPNQIEQVVLNLLANARDAVRAHCPPGGGRVVLRLGVEGDWARLVLQDNGGGIPAHLVDTIFEPFLTTKVEGAGTGLGLSISANIISGMGGRIAAENGHGGACFTVHLPLHPQPPPACDPLPEPLTPPAGAAPHGRILVVDDEALAVECIADFLEARGFQVLTATAPAQAIELAGKGGIDLVISDMRMPGMGGMELLERLRQGYETLPAIMMTGGPVPGNGSPCDTKILRKPLALDELLSEVRTLLPERRPPCST
jgi:PAS domain S-box/PAS domain S-box